MVERTGGEKIRFSPQIERTDTTDGDQFAIRILPRSDLYIRDYSMKKLLKVKLLPRSSSNEIIRTMPDGTLKIKLTAPPVDGKANEALIDLVSKEFDVVKSSVRIVRGQTSRVKVVEIND